MSSSLALELCSSCVKTFVLYRKTPIVRSGLVICDEESFRGLVLDERLKETSRGVFVSLYKQGSLRGFMEVPSSLNMTVAEALIKASIGAAFQDPSFEAVTAEELSDLEYCIDIIEEKRTEKGGEGIWGIETVAGYRRGSAVSSPFEGSDIEKLIEKAMKKGDILEKEHPLVSYYLLDRTFSPDLV